MNSYTGPPRIQPELPPQPQTQSEALAASAQRKAIWRLVPFLCAMYILNILDRTNLGFARLTMQEDLGLSDDVFGLGYGIFYAGYLVFEVPANLLLRRVGARRWMARIMISWGLVSCGMMFVTGPWSFYALRILLGIAEAGFFPGIILYLTYWFPDRERGRVIAMFMTAISLSGVVGYPLSGLIMQYLHEVAGLTGWQWLFLLEGLPSVLIGFLVYLALPDGPAQANWLTPEERAVLVERLQHEENADRFKKGHLTDALLSHRIWLLIAIYFTVAAAANAAGAQFPTLLSQRFSGWSKLGLGCLAALPHVCAILAMTLLGMSSDRTGERRGHVAFTAFLGGFGWALASLSSSPWLGLWGLCMAQAGMMGMLPLFWAMTTASVRGTAAAGGIALINSVANLGGLFSPLVVERHGPATMAVTLFAGGAMVAAVQKPKE